MSTFGKKALIWWDYHNYERENIRRYMSTPHSLQLKILEKWYPIGMIVQVSTEKYEIINHVLTLRGYEIELKNLNEDIRLKLIRNPLTVTPLKSEIIQLKRHYKLEKLFE